MYEINLASLSCLEFNVLKCASGKDAIVALHVLVFDIQCKGLE